MWHFSVSYESIVHFFDLVELVTLRLALFTFLVVGTFQLVKRAVRKR